ncbi:tenascin-X-like [Ruditapes philippinarum]|uniref:tenascin-X-like n=1 Tax=Ruditapes philippinarum TaxID=129788 RepID=UPI00295B6D1A|nr:tenascin-X-like [Ruditapes philippinarum]
MTLEKVLLIGFLLLSISVFAGEAKGLDETCTPPTNGAKDECTVANSECKTSTCVCKTGFIKDNEACLKVFGRVCDENNHCPADSKTECKSGKCVCEENYEEKNDVCTLTVSGTDCSSVTTACDNIGNAVCDTGKCKCKPDYVMNVDKCDPKNAATTIGFGAMSLALLLSTASFVLF